MDYLFLVFCKIWKVRENGFFLILYFTLLMLGCTRSIPPAKDESLIKKEFFIPPKAKMI